MKRVFPPQTAMSLFMALFVATMLTLAGCSTGTLSGPDLDTSGEATLQEAPPSYGPGAGHNEEEDAGKKGKKAKSPSGNSTSGNGGNSAISGSAYHNSG